MRLRSVVATGFLSAVLSASAQSAPQHLFFRVTLPETVAQPESGRLLVFVKAGKRAKAVEISEFRPTDTYVAGEDVEDWKPGTSIDIDMDADVFPAPLSSLKPGDYQAQAVLDVHHTYNYSGREPGEPLSPVVTLANWTPGQGNEPALRLSEAVPARPERPVPADLQAGGGSLELADLASPVLRNFSGRETHLRAWVVLPPGYREHTGERYPTVYWTHGFGGNLAYSKMEGLEIEHRMQEGKMPPMIWVMLDESLPTGTHEFADSVNNGPWGAALTREFIPYLESKYRMDASPSGRFLEGHSSGGWATLQLQVNYPRLFGGTWSTSPDPSDFHDFTGVDLYAPHANVYHRPDGTPYPLVRDHDHVIATFEQFARLEAVLGSYGGQIASFEWVFSPRGADGEPEQMFDRKTGAVHPEVVDYWRDHYDLAHLVAADWTERGPYLKGKIHLIVGTADTFYLNGAAHKFEAVLNGLGADPHFTYRTNRTHFDLYEENGDRLAMFDQIAAQMYAVARPHAHGSTNTAIPVN